MANAEVTISISTEMLVRVFNAALTNPTFRENDDYPLIYDLTQAMQNSNVKIESVNLNSEDKGE